MTREFKPAQGDPQPHGLAQPSEGELLIEVLCSANGLGTIRKVRVPLATTVREAMEASGLMREYPQLGEREWILSSHGRRIQASAPVLSGQRIEILGPLLVSPKEARRQLAAKRASQDPSGRRRGG